ncbi:hypothetical protein BDV33DRAFT_133222 [Aspergillus novoparasiticus]|uniref:Uncharacterized protein n=1 Tax=Aspergillus novoparasiticus TaxID=986946 RepID=A0A5N6ELY4_9EURO|nr:hypothetical protein BDV33DRAFT_133222 [Aspergillus novoparasiticus]
MIGRRNTRCGDLTYPTSPVIFRKVDQEFDNNVRFFNDWHFFHGDDSTRCSNQSEIANSSILSSAVYSSMEQHPEFGTTIRIQCKCRTVFVRFGAVGIFGDSGGSIASPKQSFSDSFLIFRNIYFISFPFLPWNFSFLGHVYLRLNITTGLGRGLRSQLSVQKSTMKNSVGQHVISVFDRHKEGHNEESPDLNATSSISMQWKAATCPDMDDKRWVERH